MAAKSQRELGFIIHCVSFMTLVEGYFCVLAFPVGFELIYSADIFPVPLFLSVTSFDIVTIISWNFRALQNKVSGPFHCIADLEMDTKQVMECLRKA